MKCLPSARGQANRVLLRKRGHALKACPLPLLRVEKMRHFSTYVLSTCWRALGLPAADEDWTNAMTLDYFRMQQQKVAAFASGMMKARLGAVSGVSWLDEQALVMIADELLGGWGLLKEWQERSLQPMCDVTRMLSNTSNIYTTNTCRTYSQRFGVTTHAGCWSRCEPSTPS
jgi:hypothetical protein